MLYLGWFPLAFFTVTSFKGVVEPNWPIIAYPAIFLLATINFKKIWSILASILFWAPICLYSLIIFSTPLNYGPEKLNESKYFDPIITYLKDSQADVNLYYFGSYQMTSVLSFKLNMNLKKLNKINRIDFYDDLYQDLPSAKTFYLIKESWVPLPSWADSKQFNFNKTKNINEKFEEYVVHRIGN